MEHEVEPTVLLRLFLEYPFRTCFHMLQNLNSTTMTTTTTAATTNATTTYTTTALFSFNMICITCASTMIVGTAIFSVLIP